MTRPPFPIPWMKPGDNFPTVSLAWPANSDAPGLLAAGGDLRVQTLLNAYSQGIFPWFSDGQPILWWSPDPRMVLQTKKFKLHDSLRKTIKKFRNTAVCEIRIDSAFPDVIRSCAESPRSGQPGTWIVPQMQAAYGALHRAGYAHSIETWIDGKLAGGLYCVGIGHAVFGESMFARQTDASKIALCALVALCRANNIAAIDCQQNTPHLASLGATELPREEFLRIVPGACNLGAVNWQFTPLYWQLILEKSTAACD